MFCFHKQLFWVIGIGYLLLIIVSEFYDEPSVYLSARQVVGHCPLAVGDVGHPVIAVNIGDAEEVEAVDAQPYLFYDGG